MYILAVPHTFSLHILVQCARIVVILTWHRHIIVLYVEGGSVLCVCTRDTQHCLCLLLGGHRAENIAEMELAFRTVYLSLNTLYFTIRMSTYSVCVYEILSLRYDTHKTHICRRVKPQTSPVVVYDCKHVRGVSGSKYKTHASKNNPRIIYQYLCLRSAFVHGSSYCCGYRISVERLQGHRAIGFPHAKLHS